MALTATVTPGKTFVGTELVTNSKLNQLAAPTVAVAGTVDTDQITNDSVTAAKAQFGAWFYCSASTSANVITLTASGHSITLVAGMIARFLADTTTTGAVNITFGGSTKDLFRNYNVELAGGDLKAGQAVEILYDGTQWQLLSVEANRQVVVGVDAGSTDAYVITPTPSVRALADITGVPVMFKAATVNTDGATLAISGLAATAIVKSYDGVLTTGDIKAGQWVCVVYDGTNFQLVSPVTVSSARATVPVRQTVLAGPVDATTAHPVLLTITGASLVVTLKATSSSPLVLAFAAGYDTSGAVDYITRLTADVASAWTVPAAAGTYYLYADRNVSTGAITYGYTTVGLIPRYAEDSPGSAAVIVNNQHTFLINEMQMYLGNGATAAVVQRVFIGHVVTNGTIATSVVSYMFQGRYWSPADTAFTLTDASTSETHKLGAKPREVRAVMVCQSAVMDYAVGDEVDLPLSGGYNAGADRFTEFSASATALSLRRPFGTYVPGLLDAAGAPADLVAADWKFRFYAGRGW